VANIRAVDLVADRTAAVSMHRRLKARLIIGTGVVLTHRRLLGALREVHCQMSMHAKGIFSAVHHIGAMVAVAQLAVRLTLAISTALLRLDHATPLVFAGRAGAREYAVMLMHDVEGAKFQTELREKRKPTTQTPLQEPRLEGWAGQLAVREGARRVKVRRARSAKVDAVGTPKIRIHRRNAVAVVRVIRRDIRRERVRTTMRRSGRAEAIAKVRSTQDVHAHHLFALSIQAVEDTGSLFVDSVRERHISRDILEIDVMMARGSVMVTTPRVARELRELMIAAERRTSRNGAHTDLVALPRTVRELPSTVTSAGAAGFARSLMRTAPAVVAAEHALTTIGIK
jgi:hypothetical protein